MRIINSLDAVTRYRRACIIVITSVTGWMSDEWVLSRDKHWQTKRQLIEYTSTTSAFGNVELQERREYPAIPPKSRSRIRFLASHVDYKSTILTGNFVLSSTLSFNRFIYIDIIRLNYIGLTTYLYKIVSFI